MTTVEAIYENGIFKSISDVLGTLGGHERRRIIETETLEDLQSEIIW